MITLIHRGWFVKMYNCKRNVVNWFFQNSDIRHLFIYIINYFDIMIIFHHTDIHTTHTHTIHIH